MSGAWRRTCRRAVPGDVRLPAELDPLLRRLYAGRGVCRAVELDYSLARLPSFEGLPGVAGAAALLARAVTDGWRILVVGDFDADGATSCALAMRGLRALGARAVDYLVPSRFAYGYGLTPELVPLAAARGPDLIVTVDNGIGALEGVRRARAEGMRVLVTDHHLPGEVLPEADAIVNPRLPGGDFPAAHLAGVGVVFYLLTATRARLRDGDWFARRRLEVPRLAELLDLVALGTVADLVPLDHANRTLVSQGLARIRAGHCCPGVTALMARAGRDRARASAADLGYAVAPRLNAAGRLEDMALGIECLLADAPAEAAAHAERLDALNRQRRAIQADMEARAREAVEALGGAASARPGACLFDPCWHEGVVGLVASRMRERLQRPVVAFARGGDGALKGSARSVPGVHIRDVLDAVARRHPGLVGRFGGHAMAAGLSIAEPDLGRFTEALEGELDAWPAARRGEELMTDGELARGQADLHHAELLRAAGPWGQGFPEPVFEGRFEVRSCRPVGEAHLKMTLADPREGGPPLDAIAFNAGETRLARGVALDVVYRLDANEYRGLRSAQLVLEQFAEVSRGGAGGL